eukprot:scaffold236508_cov38-Prasinocladus_malaysianus.AAC.1
MFCAFKTEFKHATQQSCILMEKLAPIHPDPAQIKDYEKQHDASKYTLWGRTNAATSSNSAVEADMMLRHDLHYHNAPYVAKNHQIKKFMQ